MLGLSSGVVDNDERDAVVGDVLLHFLYSLRRLAANQNLIRRKFL